MDAGKIQIFNNIISNYNQYTPSQLHKDIIAVTGVNMEQAAEMAKEYCNLLSFWALNFAAGNTQISFQDYLSAGISLRSGSDPLIKAETGEMIVTKSVFCPMVFGFNFDLVYFSEYEDVVNPVRLNPDKFYQIRIVNTSHFMGAYIEDGILKLSDSHNRGIGVPAAQADRVNQACFDWLLQIA